MDTEPSSSESEMFVYKIRSNGAESFVDILVPGLDRLISIPLAEARRLAGDLTAEIGRHELTEQSEPLSNTARRVLSFVHRYMEMKGHPPTTEEIAQYADVSRRSLKRGILAELEKKGWYRHGLGHRDGSWGGTYKRPLAPPFLAVRAPQNGQLSLLAEAI